MTVSGLTMTRAVRQLLHARDSHAHNHRSAFAKCTSWTRPLHHVKLMAQCEDLEMESGARAEDAAERRKQRKQDGRHCDQSLFGSVRKFNIINTYSVSGRHSLLSIPV